jgi:hypothetical protein
MQIKDIELRFDTTTLTKYGLFALLAWFLVDVLRLEERFRIVTVKRRRNRVRPIKRRKCPFPDEKMCLSIITTILLGIKRFENVNVLLHNEIELPKLLGLPRFFEATTARNFISQFTLWHLRQLDKANIQLLKDFGESACQDFPVLDIDSTTHSLESRKREGAVPGFNRKNKGKPCYQWSVGFVRGEVVSQNLMFGDKKPSMDFKDLVYDVMKKLNSSKLVIRGDAAYTSTTNLNFVIENGLQYIGGVPYKWIKANNDIDESRWAQYDEQTRIMNLDKAVVTSKCKTKFRVILIEKEQEPIKIKARKRRIRYGIVSNISFLKDARSLYEFYNERQTIENFFKESKNPFNAGKMPSQKFRGNQAYLYLVTIAYNCFSIFKKSICHQTCAESLLKQLEIS